MVTGWDGQTGGRGGRASRWQTRVEKGQKNLGRQKPGGGRGLQVADREVEGKIGTTEADKVCRYVCMYLSWAFITCR